MTRNWRVCFNPRAHAGRDLLTPLAKVISMLFQSTRPRRARRDFAPTWESKQPVSIHAPTQGATPPCAETSPPCAVSIHAPTQGATISSFTTWLVLKQFQSTRPRRARRHAPRRSRENFAVSIHAPTQGATIITGNAVQDVISFNPRAHAGRDGPR